MSVLRVGNPNRICLHHAAVNGIPADLAALKTRLAGYEVTHSKKTWAQTTKTGGEYGYYYISYHRAIAGNGHELVLQDDKYVMYHAGDNANGTESFNLHGIGVLIDGNYMTDKPNALQLEAFARIIARFEKQYKVDVLVRGHKQVSLTATSCPGTNLGDNTTGFLKDAIARANVIVKDNLPTNPLQEDVVTPEPIDCEKEIERLQGELSARETALAASQVAVSELTKALKMSQERVATLEDNLELRDTELDELQVQYDRVVEERNKMEIQYNEAVMELNALKKERESFIYQLADIIYNLFSKRG